MRAFEFPLRRALAWRRTQLGLEEDKLRKFGAALEELRLAAAKADLVRSRAEQTVREATQIEASELWALGAYRRRLIAQKQTLVQRQRECEQQIAGQRHVVLEAQRRCRLLEKLEERRRAEWRVEMDRETENLAAESYLAAWNRQSG
jgi:hypothetical protein